MVYYGMKIKENNLSTRRTRNRIEAHGLHGFLLVSRKNPQSKPSWLFRSRATGWLGWLPFTEFDFVDACPDPTKSELRLC